LARSNTDQDAFPGVPGLAGLGGGSYSEQFVVHAFGGSPEGEFSESEEVSSFEEAGKGLLDFFGNVDLAFFQTEVEFFGGDVYEFDFVGAVEDGIGDGFLDEDAGDLGDDVSEAF